MQPMQLRCFLIVSRPSPSRLRLKTRVVEIGMDAAVAAAGTRMVAATRSVLALVSAKLDVVKIVLVDEHVLGGKRLARKLDDLMSMCQPVKRAARRAFWPSLPMASESWSSGTTTVA